jgi:hypothetical protein
MIMHTGELQKTMKANWNIKTLCLCVCARTPVHILPGMLHLFMFYSSPEDSSHKEHNTNALPNYQSALAKLP